MFTTVSADEPTKQHIWQSAADGSFTVVEDPRGPTLGRGSRVTMILKEEAAEYLRRDKVTDIVGKYSQFMSHPIYVQKTEAEMSGDDDGHRRQVLPIHEPSYLCTEDRGR